MEFPTNFLPMKSITRIPLLLLLAGVLLVCATPFIKLDLQTSPEWMVRITDEQGAVVAGKTVVQKWRYYGLDHEDFSQKLTTDGAGVVRFPERRTGARMSMARLILQKSFGWLAVHASFGPRASVCLSGEDSLYFSASYYGKFSRDRRFVRHLYGQPHQTIIVIPSHPTQGAGR